MIVVMLMAGLIALGVLAARFGADSREVGRAGWIVERPKPVRGGATAAAGEPQAAASPTTARHGRPALQST